MNHQKTEILEGGIHTDERGVLLHNNGFDLTPVKRFYIIKHPDRNVVRAWQGHQVEHKYFMCIKGSFVVAWKAIDEYNKPINNDQAEFTILKAEECKVLSIPSGYANGLKALTTDSEIIVFSDYKLNECREDQISFNRNLWLDWDQF